MSGTWWECTRRGKRRPRLSIVIEWSNTAAQTLIGVAASDAGQALASCVRDPLLDEYLQKGDYSRALTLFAPTDRTRILSLTGLLEQLEPEVADSNTGQRITGIMQDQAHRMRDLISDLLALARIESDSGKAKEEIISVADLLAPIIEEAHTLGEQGGHVVLTEIQSGYGIRGNASELRTAFTNLVVNAIRHTPNRAEVHIRWAADTAGGYFSVRDTGAGIPARHIPRLTERFYRVDSSRSRDTGGTGLGLSIVKQVLDKHEATLEITSATGHGSTFSCHFPSTRTVRLAG